MGSVREVVSGGRRIVPESPTLGEAPWELEATPRTSQGRAGLSGSAPPPWARCPSSSRFTGCGLSQEHVEPLCWLLSKCEDLNQLE